MYIGSVFTISLLRFHKSFKMQTTKSDQHKYNKCRREYMLILIGCKSVQEDFKQGKTINEKRLNKIAKKRAQTCVCT